MQAIFCRLGYVEATFVKTTHIHIRLTDLSPVQVLSLETENVDWLSLEKMHLPTTAPVLYLF
jgi:hypothetical protein